MEIVLLGFHESEMVDLVDGRGRVLTDATYDAVRVTGRSVKVLTHCNTGSLATAGYGTALGVIRSINALGRSGPPLSNRPAALSLTLHDMT